MCSWINLLRNPFFCSVCTVTKPRLVQEWLAQSHKAHTQCSFLTVAILYISAHTTILQDTLVLQKLGKWKIWRDLFADKASRKQPILFSDLKKLFLLSFKQKTKKSNCTKYGWSTTQNERVSWSHVMKKNTLLSNNQRPCHAATLSLN